MTTLQYLLLGPSTFLWNILAAPHQLFIHRKPKAIIHQIFPSGDYVLHTQCVNFSVMYSVIVVTCAIWLTNHVGDSGKFPYLTTVGVRFKLPSSFRVLPKIWTLEVGRKMFTTWHWAFRTLQSKKKERGTKYDCSFHQICYVITKA